MKRRRILLIVGARPQFVKAAALVHAHRSNPPFRSLGLTLLNTGQHYDPKLSTEIFENLKLPPFTYNLRIGKFPVADQFTRMITLMTPVIKKARPDAVMVFGDTTSTVAGAFAAHLHKVPLIHVEAGLRSGDQRMPEESNRKVTDLLSDYLFCPTGQAMMNLANERIGGQRFNIGDVMVDVLMRVVRQLKLKRDPKHYYLATIHRNTNTDNPGRLHKILSALNRLDKNVILTLHPRTKAVISSSSQIRALLKRAGRIRMIPPVPYTDMLRYQIEASAIITDSGGLQKEAYLLNVPCVTLRESTEWTETLVSGRNRLCEPDALRMRDAIRHAARACRRSPEMIYGNGDAAARILNILRQAL